MTQFGCALVWRQEDRAALPSQGLRHSASGSAFWSTTPGLSTMGPGTPPMQAELGSDRGRCRRRRRPLRPIHPRMVARRRRSVLNDSRLGGRVRNHCPANRQQRRENVRAVYTRHTGRMRDTDCHPRRYHCPGAATRDSAAGAQVLRRIFRPIQSGNPQRLYHLRAETLIIPLRAHKAQSRELPRSPRPRQRRSSYRSGRHHR